MTIRTIPRALGRRIEESRETLRLAADMSLRYYGLPLAVAYSGGKDSDVLLHLARRFLPRGSFEVLHSHTTADAPQTVRHVRSVFRSLEHRRIRTAVHMPAYKGESTTMWKLIGTKGPPTRRMRYCCAILKESATAGRLTATGVRRDESAARRGRDSFTVRGKTKRDARHYSLEHAAEAYADAQTHDAVWDCSLITAAKGRGNLTCSPLYGWSAHDIWDYIGLYGIRTCALYRTGYSRVGCVLCPMASYRQVMKECRDFPKYRDAYVRAFGRYLLYRESRGQPPVPQWTDGEAVFRWWVRQPDIPGQLSLEVRDGAA